MNREVVLFEKLLKDKGYSLTAPRRALFTTLQNHNALSMAQLTELLHDCDRATIYRCVNLFEELGVASRLQLGWKYKIELSDTFAHHHHHLSCSKCGRIIVLPEDSTIERQIQKIGQLQGFKANDHQLEIHGLCAACQAQSKSPEGNTSGLAGSLTLPSPA